MDIYSILLFKFKFLVNWKQYSLELSYFKNNKARLQNWEMMNPSSHNFIDIIISTNKKIQLNTCYFQTRIRLRPIKIIF